MCSGSMIPCLVPDRCIDDTGSLMAFIENESQEKLLLERGEVYLVNCLMGSERQNFWEFDKLEIKPGTKKPSSRLPVAVINVDIKVQFSFTGKGDKLNYFICRRVRLC